jgi:hypothetical protein
MLRKKCHDLIPPSFYELTKRFSKRLPLLETGSFFHHSLFEPNVQTTWDLAQLVKGCNGGSLAVASCPIVWGPSKEEHIPAPSLLFSDLCKGLAPYTSRT